MRKKWQFYSLNESMIWTTNISTFNITKRGTTGHHLPCDERLCHHLWTCQSNQVWAWWDSGPSCQSAGSPEDRGICELCQECALGKIQTPGNFRSHGPGPSTMRGKGSTYGLKDVKEIARKSVRSTIAGSFSSKLFSHKERKFEPPEFRVEVHHSRNIF